MLILPGFARPTVVNLYDLFYQGLTNIEGLISNFYLMDQGDFFIIWILNGLLVNFLLQIHNVGKLWGSRFSPTLSNEYWKLINKYYKYQTWTFAYGDNYSYILTYFLICSVYFNDIFFILIIFIIYLYSKYISDLHCIINFYRKEIESSGKLIHNVLSIVLICVIISQLYVLFNLISVENYIYIIFLIFLISYTIIFFFIFQKPWLYPLYFPDENKNIKYSDYKKWHDKFTHPSILNKLDIKDYYSEKLIRRDTINKKIKKQEVISLI